jgi:hypothetical protein
MVIIDHGLESRSPEPLTAKISVAACFPSRIHQRCVLGTIKVLFVMPTCDFCGEAMKEVGADPHIYEMNPTDADGYWPTFNIEIHRALRNSTVWCSCVLCTYSRELYKIEIGLAAARHHPGECRGMQDCLETRGDDASFRQTSRE